MGCSFHSGVDYDLDHAKYILRGLWDLIALRLSHQLRRGCPMWPLMVGPCKALQTRPALLKVHLGKTGKPWPGLCPGSLTAAQHWAELTMTACNPPLQTGKRSAHSGSARCLPHLQLTVLLFNGPEGKISEKGDTPLIWVPQKVRASKRINYLTFLVLLQRLGWVLCVSDSVIL